MVSKPDCHFVRILRAVPPTVGHETRAVHEQRCPETAHYEAERESGGSWWVNFFTCLYMFIHIYMFIHVYTCLYMFIHIYMFIHVYTCLYMFIHVCTCLYMFIHVCVTTGYRLPCTLYIVQ